MSLYVCVKQIWAFLLELITDPYWSTCIYVIRSPTEKKRAIILLLNLLTQLQKNHLDYETDNYMWKEPQTKFPFLFNEGLTRNNPNHVKAQYEDKCNSRELWWRVYSKDTQIIRGEVTSTCPQYVYHYIIWVISNLNLGLSIANQMHFIALLFYL